MDLFATISTLVSNLAVRRLGDRASAHHSVRKVLPWSSVQKISGRTREIIKKASAGEGSIERTMAYLCEQLPDMKLSVIEGFVRGSAEMTPEQARLICGALGASYSYLWLGDGRPFYVEDEYPPLVKDYLSLFRASDIEYVLFVRGNRMPHVGYVVLKYAEFRYRVLHHRWHISRENGRGGSAALSELALLSENIHKTHSYSSVVRGIEVSSKIAESVLDGELHPRALWAKRYKLSRWWDDLADIDHKRSCAKEYSSLYDEEFFAAQRLIQWVRKDGGS